MSAIEINSLEPTPVAPADQLFFRGQLLPLQLDPRLQLVQTLSKEEGDGCILQQDVIHLRSCRLEQLSTDAGAIDSRSSSFRSQHSNFWEAGEKDSRDSTSSSRCSNGSSQDSCFPPEKKPPTNDESIRKMGGSAVPGKSQRPTPTKWSWKSIFNTLKKVSKVWVDAKADVAQRQSSSKPEIPSQKRIAFPLIGIRRSGKSLGSKSTGKTSQCRNAQSNRKTSSIFFSLRDIEPQKDIRRISARNRTPDFSTVSARHVCACIDDRSKYHHSWHTRERWKRCVDKMKPVYWKISHQRQQPETKTRSATNLMKTAHCDRRGGYSCRSSSCTPLAKSPVRREYEYIYNSSGTYFAVASCPASMGSSPHHSGVLAAANKSLDLSSMNDLHIAVQGAIAHCKQSQSGRISLAATEAIENSKLED